MKFSCFNPILLTLDKVQKMPVPCGKCVYCKTRKVNAWAFRIAEEEKYSYSAYFLTLTFEDKHIKATENGLMTLQKQPFQKFIKRLRKYEETNGNNNKLTYYMCGEYGGKTHRPHYHVLLFNATEKGINYAWKDPDCKQGKQLGHIHWGKVEEGSIKYTVKYMTKIGKIPMYDGDDRLKEFSLMSKGLGKKYIEKMKNWHLEDIQNRSSVTLKGGIKQPMPRYYREKIFTDKELIEFRRLHAERILKNQKEFEQLAKSNYDIVGYRKEAEQFMTNKFNKTNELRVN